MKARRLHSRREQDMAPSRNKTSPRTASADHDAAQQDAAWRQSDSRSLLDCVSFDR